MRGAADGKFPPGPHKGTRVEQPEIESTDVLSKPTPSAQCAKVLTVGAPQCHDATSHWALSRRSEVAESGFWVKRKRATVMKARARQKEGTVILSLGLSYIGLRRKQPDASPTLPVQRGATRDFLLPPIVEATSDSSAPVTHAAQSPPQTGPKAFEGMPVDQLMGEFDMVTAQQAALVAQLRARFSNERSQIMQKDEEILLPRTQLADVARRGRFSRSFNATEPCRGKMRTCFVQGKQERADAAEYKASCHWAVKYLEGGKNNHFAGLDDFRQKVEGLLEKQEEKLRKLSTYLCQSSGTKILNPFALEKGVPLKESWRPMP
ncbi:hypothetical protein Tco_0644490 [Tanacetum coccineum]